MMKRQKLMILGGSNCQLHAIIRAKERGIETVLADYTDDPPGRAFADSHIAVSTFDVGACIDAAKREQIDGVLAVGTDQPVRTAHLVARALSLPSHLTDDQALAVTNKRRMKEIYREHGIRTASFCYLSAGGYFTDESGKEIPLTLRSPYVIKPLDSQGQRGVFFAKTKEALFSYLPETLSFSKETTCLVEEYVESDEITVSGWVRGGTFFPLTITDRIRHPDPVHIGVCTGHRYPSVHIAKKEEVITLCRQVTEAFSLREGPFYFQILVGKDALYANELACRIGGAFEDITIPYLTGFPLLDAATDLALGKEGADAPVLCHDEQSKKRCFVPLFFCRPGRVAHVTPKEELLQMPFVTDCGYNFRTGDTIPDMQNATARFGHAVITGDNETMSARIRAVFEALHVKNEAGEELLCDDLIEERFFT